MCKEGVTLSLSNVPSHCLVYSRCLVLTSVLTFVFTFVSLRLHLVWMGWDGHAWMGGRWAILLHLCIFAMAVASLFLVVMEGTRGM